MRRVVEDEQKCEQSTYAIAAVVLALAGAAAFVYNYTATGSAAATEQNGTFRRR